MKRSFALLALASSAFAVGCGESESTLQPSPQAVGLAKLNHVVVIVLDGHGFDHAYGDYAGAEGRASSTGTVLQIGSDGKPMSKLPPVINTWDVPPEPDSHFPSSMPNAPFEIETYAKMDAAIPPLVSRYYQEQSQIDGGKMDKFVAAGNAGSLSMGYYKSADLPLATFAAGYAVCDQFFHSAFGGPFLNDFWLVAATTPMFPNAPKSALAVLDPVTSALVTDGSVTPDGYVVNSAYSQAEPHPADAPKEELVPPQTMDTIGDRLDEAMVTWSWYSGGWDDAVKGSADQTFQFDEQPFVYFDKYAEGTDGRSQHLKDEKDFLSDAANGTLPSVSFVKPLGSDSEQPGLGDMTTGENHALDLVNAVKNGPNWTDSAIIVVYSDHGGFWDHVSPPKADRFGPGTRVPVVVISGFAKSAFVDHTKYETASILATIEHRFAIAPLSTRDAHATDLSNCFDFSKSVYP